jgi:hypothetical protein
LYCFAHEIFFFSKIMIVSISLAILEGFLEMPLSFMLLFG